MADPMLQIAFYVAGAVALFSTVMVVVNTHPVHALLYLVLSLLSIAMVFFTLGAPFAGALEIIVYAGAIMVLFVFVVMMLNLGAKTVAQERTWLKASGWIGPAVLSLILLVQLVFVLEPMSKLTPIGLEVIDAKKVGIALFGPYLLAVELASTLLLAGLVAAYHLGRHED
jgi:NADH-quinone oxidoreductase subunit J